MGSLNISNSEDNTYGNKQYQLDLLRMIDAKEECNCITIKAKFTSHLNIRNLLESKYFQDYLRKFWLAVAVTLPDLSILNIIELTSDNLLLAYMKGIY